MAYRVQHRFWLDLDKPEEEALNDQVVDLKQSRAFMGTIRDGLRLIQDLRAGRLDVLFELFPWVKTELYSESAGPSSGDNDDLKRQIERLEQLLLQQSNGPIMAPVGGPKPLAKVASSAPENDNLLVMKKAKSRGDSAKNFLDSAFNLVQ